MTPPVIYNTHAIHGAIAGARNTANATHRRMRLTATRLRDAMTLERAQLESSYLANLKQVGARIHHAQTRGDRAAEARGMDDAFQLIHDAMNRETEIAARREKLVTNARKATLLMARCQSRYRRCLAGVRAAQLKTLSQASLLSPDDVDAMRIPPIAAIVDAVTAAARPLPAPPSTHRKVDMTLIAKMSRLVAVGNPTAIGLDERTRVLHWYTDCKDNLTKNIALYTANLAQLDRHHALFAAFVACFLAELAAIQYATQYQAHIKGSAP